MKNRRNQQSNFYAKDVTMYAVINLITINIYLPVSI